MISGRSGSWQILGEKEREQEIVEALSNGEKINPLYCKTSGINVLASVYTEQYLKIFYLFSDL